MKKYLAWLVLPVLLAGASAALLAGGRFTPHALSPLLAATLNACIGVFVFLHDPRQKVNRAFALVNLVLALGSLLQFGLYVAPDATFALRWARILGPGYFLIPAASLHFCAVYTKNQSRLLRWMVALGIVYAGVFSFLALLPGFAITYERAAFKFVPRADALYGASMAVLLLFCGLSILLVIAAYVRLGPGVRKNQYKIFLAASLVALGIGSIDYLKSFGFPSFPVSSLAMAAFGLLNAYAIVRHRFLDIEVIVKKGAVYTTLTAVITLSYAGMMMLANTLFEGTSFPQSIAVNAIAVIVIAFAFQPLRNGIQILVDRWFYRNRYNYRQTLRAFGAEIIRTVGRRETALRLVHTVTETVQIGHACVAWKEKGESSYRVLAERAQDGEAVFFEAGRMLDTPGILDEHFRKGAQVLDREGLGLLAQDAPSPHEKENLLSAASWLETLGYELVIPVLVKDDMAALFLLSGKLSEAVYSAQDVELLQICANQAGVALESSVLYDRLERSRRLAVLGEMASGVAHEIKNPLGSIKIFVESLDENFSDPAFRESFASVVLPQIDGLDRMVRDLLEYARPPRLMKVDADLLDLVHITLRLLDIQKHSVTVRFDKTAGPVSVSCDGEKIKRVLLNVIQNALDAVKECESRELEISAALSDGWATVQVSDSGVGIPPENLEKLFRPFFTTKKEGTGLGLALAQKIVEDHDGSMSVTSPGGLGTKVTIRLPALGRQ